MPTTPPTPAPPFDVPNEIQVKWAAEGGATGPIGQPIAAAVVVNSTCYQSFAGGFIAASYDTSTNQWRAFVVRKNSGVTGPAWYALGSTPSGLPTSDEESVAGGSYQRFDGAGGFQYIFAPTGGTPFEVAAADTTGFMLQNAQYLFAPTPTVFGPYELFTNLGIPDRPASCTLNRGGCELLFGGGAWRYLKVPLFGVSGAYQPGSPIGLAYAANGAENGPIGFPTGRPWCQGTDCATSFENADISQYQGIAHLIKDPFRPGGIATTDAVCGLPDGRCKQSFIGAVKFATGSTVFAVLGHYYDRYEALGGESGPLGFPVANQQGTSPAWQQFQGGLLASKTITSNPLDRFDPVFMVSSDMMAQFFAGGNVLGAPTADQVCTGPNGGCYQWFEYGIIWWSAATGAGALRSDRGFLFKYQELNWAWGLLGYPTTGFQCDATSVVCFQFFQGGMISSSQPATLSNPAGAPDYWVHGAIWAKYLYFNGEVGLGFPSSDEDCSPSESVCRQEFNNGTMWWTPWAGAHLLHGDIRRAWEADGRVTGVPVEDEQCTGPNGGCHQTFQNGLYWWSPNTGSHFVRAGMLAVYASLGWAWGRLGVPLTNEYAYGDGARQDFEHGAIIWHPDGHFDVIPW